MYKIKLENIQSFKCWHFLQTGFWSSFKAMHGWTPFFFHGTAETADGKKCIEFSLSLMVRRLNRLLNIAYVPLGIELSEANQKNVPYNSEEYLHLLEDTAVQLKKCLPVKVFCIRFDPPVEFSDNEEREKYLGIFERTGKDKLLLRKSPTDVQPPDTVLLPLEKTADELLEAMKPKWRYNIRLAEKKGVEIKRNSSEAIDSFYNIFMETAERDRIAVHAKSYYKSLLDLKDGDTHVKTTLYTAEHEGDVLAGIITLFTDTEAVYLYGASSNNKRNLMPAYLLQWTAIQDAKEFGSKVYDFYGIPPTDDEHHPMHGLYRFKTGFGGNVVHRAGSIDMPVSPVLYRTYIFLEKARAFWFKKVRKLLKRH